MGMEGISPPLLYSNKMCLPGPDLLLFFRHIEF